MEENPRCQQNRANEKVEGGTQINSKSPEKVKATWPPPDRAPGLSSGLQELGTVIGSLTLETGTHPMQWDTGLASCHCPLHLFQMPPRSDKSQDTVGPRVFHCPGAKSNSEFRTSLLGWFKLGKACFHFDHCHIAIFQGLKTF